MAPALNIKSNPVRAYRLGARDARMDQPENSPIYPFTSEELEAYQRGYRAEREKIRESMRREVLRAALDVYIWGPSQAPLPKPDVELIKLAERMRAELD